MWTHIFAHARMSWSCCFLCYSLLAPLGAFFIHLGTKQKKKSTTRLSSRAHLRRRKTHKSPPKRQTPTTKTKNQQKMVANQRVTAGLTRPDCYALQSRHRHTASTWSAPFPAYNSTPTLAGPRSTVRQTPDPTAALTRQRVRAQPGRPLQALATPVICPRAGDSGALGPPANFTFSGRTRSCDCGNRGQHQSVIIRLSINVLRTPRFCFQTFERFAGVRSPQKLDGRKEKNQAHLFVSRLTHLTATMLQQGASVRALHERRVAFAHEAECGAAPCLCVLYLTNQVLSLFFCTPHLVLHFLFFSPLALFFY